MCGRQTSSVETYELASRVFTVFIYILALNHAEVLINYLNSAVSLHIAKSEHRARHHRILLV